MCRSCSQNRRNRITFKILTGTPTGKGLFGRSRRRWVDNIRMYLKKIDTISKNSVDSAQNRDY